MLNMFESKAAAQNNGKRKKEYTAKHGVYTFEQFADVFLKEVLDKVNAAKRMC